MQIKHSLAALAFLMLSSINVGATSLQRVAPTSNDDDTIVVERNDLIEVLRGLAVREIRKQYSSMGTPIQKDAAYSNAYRNNNHRTMPVYNTVTRSVEYIPVYVPQYVGGNTYVPTTSNNDRELSKLQKQMSQMQELIEMLGKTVKDANTKKQLDSLSLCINQLKLNRDTVVVNNTKTIYVDNDEPEKQEPSVENTKDVDLTLFSTNIRQVFFHVSSTQLTTEAQQTLQSVIKLLKHNRKLTIELTGFASKDGSPSYNQDLAMRRMQRVKEYLLGNGVHHEQITSLTYGIDKQSDLKTYGRRVELCIAM